MFQHNFNIIQPFKDNNLKILLKDIQNLKT